MQFTREDNKLNEYHAWGANPATYDEDIPGWGSPQHANGVLMQDGNVTAGYNSLNQMVLVNTAAMGSEWMFFGYDPLGRRVKQWTGALSGNNLVPEPGPGTATYFYYDGWNLIQEGPAFNSASRNYIHGARVDEIVKQITPDNWWERYFHYDARGHCTLQTDASGNVVEQYDYDAFGKPYSYDWTGTALVQYNAASGQWEGYSPWGNRFLFTGREWLPSLKLYDYRNRIYQPELGRFMQPDPMHFAAGDYNLYRYCHNDPVNRSDPTGLVQQTASDWNRQRYMRSGSTLSSREFDLLKQGQAYLAPPNGNYKEPLKNHVAKNGETGGDPGKTRYVLAKPQEVDGKLIIQPTLDWWVREQKLLHTDVVKRELEHVSRWLYWQESGAGAEMVSHFNRRPGGKEALDSQAETARFRESMYQDFDRDGIHAKGRHSLDKHPAKDMDPDVLERLIQNVGPAPFPHHLNDAGLQ